MKLRDIARKVLAIVALLGLVISTTPALADSLSALETPDCCTSGYCPLHHQQSRTPQKDMSDCGAHGKSGLADCSMRACDTTPAQAVEIAPFVLSAALTISREDSVQDGLPQASRFVPFTVSVTTTPPPRTLTN